MKIISQEKIKINRQIIKSPGSKKKDKKDNEYDNRHQAESLIKKTNQMNKNRREMKKEQGRKERENY